MGIGPQEDQEEGAEDPFTLWRMPLASLGTASPIRVECIRDDLPPSSEGVTFASETAFFVIDGDEGEEKKPDGEKPKGGGKSKDGDKSKIGQKCDAEKDPPCKTCAQQYTLSDPGRCPRCAGKK